MESVSTNHKSNSPKTCFLEFTQSVIDELDQFGKIRTAETYRSTLNSFRKFYKRNSLPFKKVDAKLMLSYQNYLMQKGLNMNSISFYNRILRAVYNRAIGKNLIKNKNPFKHVYTGVDKTLKRAISLPYIKKIKNLKFPEGSTEELAKDIFMFSFYTRGMSFIDISYLQKKDLKNGILTYRRRKTGQILFIRWEPCMEDIVNKYFNPDSPYLLPIITAEGENGRKQYILKSHKINEALKRIGKKINLETPLTMYVARHSWASIAQHKRIPLSVISKGMGHDSEETTRIYLNSIDNNRIDRANSMILKSL